MEPTGKVVSVHGATIVGETMAAEHFSVGSYVSVIMPESKILGVISSLELVAGDAVRFTANLFGKFSEGRFQRGTEELPYPGASVELPT
ncbi:MAG TPA: hypothetical protein PL001_12855, partial [Candidatus Kryptobacter bacterium]|nr:hypothetical protein [Candidatus Kryptobacter bacterium]